MTELARRALTNAARALEDEARRRRHVLLGGHIAMEQEVAFIREHLDELVGAVKVKKAEAA